MKKTEDRHIDLLSPMPSDRDAADTQPIPSTLPIEAQPETPIASITAQPMPDTGFPDEIIEMASDAFDVAVQEAIRATTPKRRDLTLAGKLPGRRQQGPRQPSAEQTFRPEPPLWTYERILEWADAYYAQYGSWPNRDSSPSAGTQGKTWNAIGLSLYHARRGLPGNMTLPRLLTTYRGKRYYGPTENGEFLPLYIPNPEHDPELFTLPQILARADAWRLQYGTWPNENSGPIFEGAEITWCGIDSALRVGSHDLPGGSSLPRLLAAERGMRNSKDLPILTQEQILEWADLYQERTGQWPNNRSGGIEDAPGETWAAADAALHCGGRGLPGGSSLTVLLEEERGRRNCKHVPSLTEAQILLWADNHKAQTGDWPHNDSGPIFDAPEETWSAINASLAAGSRSLPGGSSLRSLLMDHRSVRNRKRLPHLTNEQILLWADAYQERHGEWPQHNSGPIEGAQGETWNAVAIALYAGQRGMPGGATLPRLLKEHRGAPYKGDLLPFSIAQILDWADAWHMQNNKWPIATSGPIFPGADTTWMAVHTALASGNRGLPGGSSLARLLKAERGVRYHLALPPLTREQILEWADLHKERTGRWPTKGSGAITDAPGEKWSGADAALYVGSRSLPGGSSLAILLEEERGRRNHRRVPPLTETQILQWADAYHTQTGRWPTHKSSPIPDAPGEKWSAINAALDAGNRGLTEGSSLAKLLLAQRGVRR